MAVLENLWKNDEIKKCSNNCPNNASPGNVWKINEFIKIFVLTCEWWLF